MQIKISVYYCLVSTHRTQKPLDPSWQWRVFSGVPSAGTLVKAGLLEQHPGEMPSHFFLLLLLLF